MKLEDLIKQKQEDDILKEEFSDNLLRLCCKLDKFFEPAKGVLNAVYFRYWQHRFMFIIPSPGIKFTPKCLNVCYVGNIYSAYVNLSVEDKVVVRDLLDKDFNNLSFSSKEEE